MTFIDKKISSDRNGDIIKTATTESKDLSAVIRTDSCLVLPPDATVREATELMCKYHCGAVGIVDNDEQLVGLITDRDILKKVISRNRNPSKVTVSSIMINNPESIDHASDANAALDIVATRGYRYLPVLKEGRMIAILDVRDLYEEVRRIMTQALDQKDLLLSYVFHEPYGGYPHIRM